MDRIKGVVQILPLIIIAFVIGLAIYLRPQFAMQKAAVSINTSTAESTIEPTTSPLVSVSPSPTAVSTLTPKPSIVASATPVPIAVTKTPPTSGYQRINVASDMGTFTVDIAAADIATTKVIVDTASDSDCSNDCPTLPLSTYVSRRGAYAGINGTYFCPLEYPSCAGKTNTFDLLVMNSNKYYFNSGNNVYSTNPGVIISGGYVRFVGQILEWGRDTGPDMVLSNYPMLVQGGNIAFPGSGDPKFTSRGNRSFIANKGNTVYIGVVRSVTMMESAHTLKALGMDNTLNLDNGGSVAFWYGGYKAGPGRNIPNAILFVNR